MITRTDGTASAAEAQQMEIRALAVQAAATFWANRKLVGEDTEALLEQARQIEVYIAEGRIPGDDDLDDDLDTGARG